MTQVTCPGVVVTDTSGVAMCQDMGGAPLAWSTQPEFSVEALDPALMSAAYGAGFFVMAMGWVVTRAVRVVLDMLK